MTVPGNKTGLKVASIGQAIIQATRPTRVMKAPLQLGLTLCITTAPAVRTKKYTSLREILPAPRELTYEPWPTNLSSIQLTSWITTSGLIEPSWNLPRHGNAITPATRSADTVPQWDDGAVTYQKQPEGQ